ncbi:hypothetical protein E2I00_018329 [Balaenoptera physalus]|uniref:G-protein coupled receptors family 1 profile domain-containing protein n=1 Tax=Balaenoptera physalus TaxID=9770 RepID=A0A643BRT4_BALPH|nr:hypothetical protein E2I00_018329 [Balaenoptera physalus]
MSANVTMKPLCPLLEQMSRLQSHSNSSIRYIDHASTVVTTWVLHLALSDLLATASLPFFTYFLANHRTVAVAHRVCLALWALAVLNTVPYFIFRDTIPRVDGRIMCYYNVLLLNPGPDRDATDRARSQDERGPLNRALRTTSA